MSTIPPPPVPNAPRPADPRGSLVLGVIMAWGTLIGGYVVVALLAGMLPSSSDVAPYVVLMLLPWIAMVALALGLTRKGKPRTAKGVLIGIASIFGVGLLLLAACFGLLTTSNFH